MGGINWPGRDSRGKSSACAGQLASNYSLFCKTEMEGLSVTSWLSFGNEQLKKGPHMDGLTPLPSQALTPNHCIASR